MPADHRHDPATVELVANTWYQDETPSHHLPPTYSETGRRYREHAAAVLDALTAAGWSDPSRITGYVVDGKRYHPLNVQIVTGDQDD